MPIKKNLSSAKKTTNAMKRHPKLAAAPKGEKFSSMKTVDASSPILQDHCKP
jgi:hypothetical protein